MKERRNQLRLFILWLCHSSQTQLISYPARMYYYKLKYNNTIFCMIFVLCGRRARCKLFTYQDLHHVVCFLHDRTGYSSFHRTEGSFLQAHACICVAGGWCALIGTIRCPCIPAIDYSIRRCAEFVHWSHRSSRFIQQVRKST